MQIQFEINASKEAQLKALMEQANFGSYDDLFNNAVTLLQWCIQQVRDGRTIIAASGAAESEIELSMPFLEQVAKWASEDSELLVSSRRTRRD